MGGFFYARAKLFNIWLSFAAVESSIFNIHFIIQPRLTLITMKNPAKLTIKAKIAAMMLMTVGLSQPLVSQDTLHLNYVQIQTKLPDSTDAKLSQWVKSLNGRHVELTVLAYYHKAEFKKYAQERADDMFLVLNRKARALITIQSIGPKKGESSQRSRVDIVYTISGGNPAPEAAKTESTKALEGKSAATAKTESRQKPAPAKAESTEAAVKAEAPAARQPVAAASNAVFSPNAEIKKRKFMVVLMYGNEIYNDNVSNAFKKSWKDSEVGFITESELAATAQDKKADWVLLVPEKKEMSGLTFMNCKLEMTYMKGKKYEDYQKRFKVAVRNEASEADIHLLIYKLRVFYALREEFDRGQLKEILASKTLYVDKAMTEMSESDFKADYPFPVVFTGTDEIDGRINSRDAGTLYLKLDANGGSVNLMIVDAETGAIMSRTENGVSKSGFKKAAVGTLSDSIKQAQDYSPLTIY